MQQLVSPTPIIPCMGGWCLQYVRQAFNLPARYASATEAWVNSKSQHKDRNFPPSLWVPVWYGIDQEPLGHVVLRAPDGRVYSTSDYSGWPVIHNSLSDLEAYYAYYGMTLRYRGWTEDVAGYTVIGGTTINVDSSTPIKSQEAQLTAAEVAQINKHTTEETNRIIEYVGKVLVGGYSVGTKQFPGIAAVDINNQQTVRATLALVKAMAKNPNLTADQITEAIREGIEGSVIDVDVKVAGRSATPAQ